jgi:pimeloyl-ACP methyl ester carboxylesterase
LPGPFIVGKLLSSNLPDSFDFLRLSDGLCHYRVDGPSKGPVILLIHGATVPAWELDRLVPFLTAAGYRTLRADLFGHGYSDRPRVKYELALFVRQLSELLDALHVTKPVHLIGHSLGAAVGACLAARQPSRFSRLVLAAPLLGYTGNMKAARLLEIPLLGELLIPTYVLPMLVRRRTRRYRAIEDGRFVGKFKSQLRKPGFGRALLSLIRSGTLGDQSECYRALARHTHPILVLRGADDGIVTPRQIDVILDLAPRAVFRELGGTAHAFLLTHPEMVAPLIVDFFGESSMPHTGSRSTSSIASGIANGP